MKKKTVKEVKMHEFLVCAYKCQDFTQSQKFCARSHDLETLTFNNSELVPPNISRWKETLLKKLGFCKKYKNCKNIFYFMKVIKKIENLKSKTITLTVFSTCCLFSFLLFDNLQICFTTFEKETYFFSKLSKLLLWQSSKNQ